MYLVLWTFVGGMIGWTASILTNNDHRMGILSNIVVGLIGSFLGGVIANLFRLSVFHAFSIYGLMFSLLGAVIFLTVINLIRTRNIL
jgi:uncharacterized membrane protein YeaQ/YmgE (transglycosylase-associated protein family)